MKKANKGKMSATKSKMQRKTNYIPALKIITKIVLSLRSSLQDMAEVSSEAYHSARIDKYSQSMKYRHTNLFLLFSKIKKKNSRTEFLHNTAHVHYPICTAEVGFIFILRNPDSHTP